MYNEFMDNNPKNSSIINLSMLQNPDILLCILYSHLNELFLLPKLYVYQALLVSFIERNVECANFFAKKRIIIVRMIGI